MIVYRIASQPYIDLSGQGGLYMSGRWHHKGTKIVYTSANLETCLLEIAVNNYLQTARKIGVVMKINLPNQSIAHIDDTDYLPKEYRLDDDWRAHPESRVITQAAGRQFILDNKYLALAVPSIVIDSPTAINYLFNPDHPAMRDVTFTSYGLSFDGRL